jgi:cytoskeleton protein RodZ
MSDTPVALGVRLKAERERRGLSAAKAADQLHLDGWIIDALEAEDYERIGPSVYAKGHLKRYASLLGLPPGDILAGYESRIQAPQASAAPAANVRLRTDTAEVSNLPWPSIVGVAAVALLIVGVLWWKPWHPRAVPSAAAVSAAPAANASNSPSDAAADGSGDVAASAAPGAASGPATARAVTLAPAGVAAIPGPAAPDAAAGVGRARLRLSFSADSWVDVHDASGRRTFAGKGRANSVKVLHGVAPLRVYLGFASGVQLEINDRAVAIGPQFLAGDVARFEAGADGILRRDSRSPAASGVATPGASPRNAHPSG